MKRFEYKFEFENNEEFFVFNHFRLYGHYTGLTLGLRAANERRRYFVTTSLFGLVQA